MREYLLLLLIAFVGLSGLVVIHHDVKIQSQHDLIQFRQGPAYPRPQSHAASMEASQRLHIFQGESWAEVYFQINDYQVEETFFLDFGNGEKQPLKDSRTQISYKEPGIYLIKLYRGKHLLEASEIELLRPEIALALTP